MEMNAWMNGNHKIGRNEYPADDYSEVVGAVMDDLKEIARERYGDEDEALRIAIQMLVTSENHYEFFEQLPDGNLHIMFNTWE